MRAGISEDSSHVLLVNMERADPMGKSSRWDSNLLRHVSLKLV
jgi:hypothetical protein